MAQKALVPPTLSIPSEGFIPFSIESFTVYMHCYGNCSKQVQTEIHFTINGPTDRDPVSFSIKRNKICLQHGFKLKGNSFFFKAFALFIVSILNCVC